MTTALDAQGELFRLLHAAVDHRAAGRLGEVERVLDAAMVLLPDAPPDDVTLLAQWDIITGQQRFDEGRYAPALTAFDAAAARLLTAEQSAGADSEVGSRPDAAELSAFSELRCHAMTMQASALRSLGSHDAARDVLGAVLELARERFGADSVAAAAVHNDLGVLEKATGDYRAALAHYQTALPILLARETEAAEEIATLCHNLCGILFVLGELHDARRWGMRGVSLRARDRGADHLSVALDRANLAPTLIELGEFDGARSLLESVLERFEREYGADHYEVAVTLTNLGALDARQERWESALRLLQRAMMIKVAVFGPDDPELLRTMLNLSFVAERAGEPALSRHVATDTLRIARDNLAPGHPLRVMIEGER